MRASIIPGHAFSLPSACRIVNHNRASDLRKPRPQLRWIANSEGHIMISPFILTLFQVLGFVISVVWFIVIAHVIASWLINFQVLNLRQPLVSQLWYVLNRLTEPMYRPIRRFLPDMGGLDLAPLVVILVLFALRSLLANYTFALMYR
jgi:YggT family protein